MSPDSPSPKTPPRIDLVSLEADQLLGEMLEGFAADTPGVPDLDRGISMFCTWVNRWLAATRTSVWLHDRRARELVLRASSDARVAAASERIRSDDEEQPVMRAMRAPRAETIASPDPAHPSGIAVALRGRRRALGTLVIEGLVPSGERDPDVLDLVDWLGRTLAGAVETAQLFAGVLQARRELEHTFDSIADLVAVFDQHLTLVEANQALARRVGHPIEELRERPIRDVIGPETFDWITELTSADDDSPARVATRQIEDSRWEGTFSISMSNRVDEHGTPIGGVLVARDVTEDARLEAERHSLRERLSQAEKLAALGQFVAGIAHELNNPLQGVMGNIELVQRTKELSKSTARDLRVALREADWAAKIVRNLLVFAGAQAKPRRRLSINAVISRALAQRSKALRDANIEVTRQLAPGNVRVRGDTLLLHQAFLNIITNSEQALAAGPTRRLDVRSWISETGTDVVTQIRDSGPGIPADVLPRIFEPFYTTKEVGKGTGLGLAICFGIIQDHGGQIYAKNGDVGALFTVHLPIDQQGLAKRAKRL